MFHSQETTLLKYLTQTRQLIIWSYKWIHCLRENLLCFYRHISRPYHIQIIEKKLHAHQRWAIQRDCPAGPRARGVTERAGRDFLKLSRGGRGTGVVLSRRSGAGRTF